MEESRKLLPRSLLSLDKRKRERFTFEVHFSMPWVETV